MIRPIFWAIAYGLNTAFMLIGVLYSVVIHSRFGIIYFGSVAMINFGGYVIWVMIVQDERKLEDIRKGRANDSKPLKPGGANE